LLIHLKHRNILPFIGLSIHQNDLFLVTPLLKGSIVTLLSESVLNGGPKHVDGYVQFVLPRLNSYADYPQVLQLAQGLEFLHSKQVVHGNMSPVNMIFLSCRSIWLVLSF
jgi:serine/threonine protein kinase